MIILIYNIIIIYIKRAVTYDIKNQSEVDAITSYTNLEKL